MEDRDWAEGFAKALGVFLNGDALEQGRRGEEYSDDSFLMLFNAHHEPVGFTVPPSRWGDAWELTEDTASTATGLTDAERSSLKPGDIVDVDARSMLVLCRATGS
jgi:glycogen operon protein